MKTEPKKQLVKIRKLTNIKNKTIEELVQEIMDVRFELDCIGFKGEEISLIYACENHLTFEGRRTLTEEEAAAGVVAQKNAKFKAALDSLKNLTTNVYPLIITQKKNSISKYPSTPSHPEQEVKLNNLKSRLNQYETALQELKENLPVLEKATLFDVELEFKKQRAFQDKTLFFYSTDTNDEIG